MRVAYEAVRARRRWSGGRRGHRFARRPNGLHLPSNAVAAFLAAAATCCVSSGRQTAHADAERGDGSGVTARILDSGLSRISNNTKANQSFDSTKARKQEHRRTQKQLPPSSSRPPMIPASLNPSTTKVDKESVPRQNVIECDYVIVGHGKAGQSALRTIKQLDPAANVVVIDPNPNNNHTAQNTNQHSKAKTRERGASGVRHLRTSASYIDRAQKIIHVHPTAPPSQFSSTKNASTSKSATGVRYRKSALLATGSRGAPPPSTCIHPDARARILELRSTGLLHNYSLDGTPLNNAAASSTMQSRIPILDRPTVRSLSIMASSQGASIAIMGSGFEALELAAFCARVSKWAPSGAATNSSPYQQLQNAQHNDNTKNKVFLLFGGASPMPNCIPR